MERCVNFLFCLFWSSGQLVASALANPSNSEVMFVTKKLGKTWKTGKCDTLEQDIPLWYNYTVIKHSTSKDKSVNQ